MSAIVIPAPPAIVGGADRGVVVVVGRRAIAEGIVELALSRPDGSRLPDWAPGAHISVVVPGAGVRQYSLCGDRWDASTYRIAVQREADGRGGSAYLHDEVRVGDSLAFGGVRNNFRLAPAPRNLFIAGGVGITPVVPMIRQVDMLELDWRLLYLGRDRARLAYLDELSRWADRITVVSTDSGARADLDLWRPTDPSVRVYACGPSRLLDAVTAWGSLEGGHVPKVERFAASATIAHAPGGSFEAVAARTGAATTVEVGESIVDALRRVGIEVLTSCGQGVCGTCETGVLEGRPDHRDSILDDAERAAADCLLPCVSRCAGERLVLDL